VSLLDPNRECYFFKWTENHDVEIADESDNIIGKIKYSEKFFSYKWKLFVDNSIILTISDAWWNRLVIKNEDGNVIGYVKNKTFVTGTSIREDVLKNENKKIILIQKTTDLLNFEINDPKGRKVAEITPDSKGRSFRVLKIFDKTLDRKLLLGFFINVIDYFWPPPGEAKASGATSVLEVKRLLQLFGLGLSVAFFVWLSAILFLAGGNATTGGAIALFPLTIFLVGFYGALFQKKWFVNSKW